VGGFGFGYFTKSNLFTKNHILSYFMDDAELLKFLPSGISPDAIERDLLLSVN
jgi:hypothetical protein